MSSRQLALRCLPMEGQAMHIHPHISIMANKQMLTIPSNIGINSKSGCMTPVHIHDAGGIIHVESPAVKEFTLGDCFAVWNKAFTKDQILDYRTDATHGLKLYIDGKEVNSFENTILKDHQDIFIDYYSLADGPNPLPQPFQFDQAQL